METNGLLRGAAPVDATKGKTGRVRLSPKAIPSQEEAHGPHDGQEGTTGPESASRAVQTHSRGFGN